MINAAFIDRFFAPPEKPVEDEQELVADVRENQENLERIMPNLSPDFFSSVKGIFVHAPNSACENSDAVPVIQKNARRKLLPSVIRPKIFFFYAFAHDYQRR